MSEDKHDTLGAAIGAARRHWRGPNWWDRMSQAQLAVRQAGAADPRVHGERGAKKIEAEALRKIEAALGVRFKGAREAVSLHHGGDWMDTAAGPVTIRSSSRKK